VTDEKLGRGRYVLAAGAGEAVSFGGIGARLMLDGALSGGSFSVIENTIDPKTLAAPVHTHSREDEYSFVVEGEIGVQIGERVLTARAGDVVYKPRGVAHAFWNATDRPARILEIISPAGFERYFADMAEIMNRPGPPNFGALAVVRERYALETDVASMAALVERYGLRPPG
jgi:uncharacterized cupin superfamily protein